MLAVQNFAQAQNPRQAILCRCKISRSPLLSRIFSSADEDAKSAPCNPTCIAPYKFLCRAPKHIAYLATKSLAKWRSILSRIAQRNLAHCVVKIHSCSAKWRKILCRAVGVLRAKKARYPLPTVLVYNLTHALEFRLKLIA